MRPLLSLALLGAAFALVACQDTYSSNSERDTYMGDVRAAPPAPAPSAAAAAPAPGTAPAGNPAASASAGPSPAPSH